MELSLPRGRPDVIANFIVEYDQARGVTLIVNGEIEQRSGGKARIVHLADAVRSVVHGIARVEQHREQAVCLAAIALDAGALGAGKNIPIHVPQVVARRVSAILGEFLAEPEVGRAVQTRDESIHDRLGDQVETRKRAKYRRIEKTLHGQAPLGGGMCSSNRLKISSESTRSDSA